MPAETLQEAHAPASFYERVKALEQGEVARLEGGVAVKRLALEDGRDAFRIAAPSTYRSDPDFFGEAYRTAEDATREAFRRSARSSDPESIGGVTILSYGVQLDGSEVRIADWTLDGKVIVSPPGRPAETRTVSPSLLIRPLPALYASELLEIARHSPTSTWDPALHPRDAEGRFAQKLAGLSPSTAVRLPEGTRVRRSTGGDRYFVGGGSRLLSGASMRSGVAEFTDPLEAARAAFQGEQMARRIKGETETPAARAIRKKRGGLREDAWGGKPGTNFKQVSPEARKRISPIVSHYRKMAHPFTACVRDNTKRFGAERARKVCAVVKDMGEGTTKWRKGKGGKVTEEELVEHFTDRLIEAAEGDLEALETMMLAYILEREWTGEEVRAGVLAAYGAAVPPFRGEAPDPEQRKALALTEVDVVWLPVEEEWSEAARARALAARKAKHPDWNWEGGPVPGASVEAHPDYPGSRSHAKIRLSDHPTVDHVVVKPAVYKRGGFDLVAVNKDGSRSNLGEFSKQETKARVGRLTSKPRDPARTGDGLDRFFDPAYTNQLDRAGSVHQHFDALAGISHIGGKLPEGYKVKKAEAPDSYDMKRAENVQAVRAPDGTHLGYVAKVDYEGEDVISGRIKVGTVGAGKRWAAFTAEGRQLRGSVHFSKNRFDALRNLGRYHPKHGKDQRPKGA